MGLVIFFLFFVACSSGGNLPKNPEEVKALKLLTDWEDTKFYKVEDSDLKKTFYFEYPADAKISFIRVRGDLRYQNCHVAFGEEKKWKSTIQIQETDKKKTKADAGRVFESLYRNDVLIAYSADLRKFDYAFWIYNDGKDVSGCEEFLDKVAYSFTDKPMYVNEKYGFTVVLPFEYKMEYLADDGGVLFTGWSKGDDFDLKKNKAAKHELGGYNYKIEVKASENVMGYADLSDMLAKKYTGFTKQFHEVSGKSGVFVDENVNAVRAIRHFFVFSDDAEIIYEVSLDIESFHYFAHGKEFEDFVKTALAIY
ncbi:hypothetical protein COY05_04470 [Candidatus Peregrinibacteria bacterium CG_4_10_14_0_2_um_filter_38_24]|nr:MAG: hypothetical protein COY05_04470 [Candidatus Peregrinibacteria bacterium CG_4_10_14_0_2_um_filter_38_24]